MLKRIFKSCVTSILCFFHWCCSYVTYPLPHRRFLNIVNKNFKNYYIYPPNARWTFSMVRISWSLTRYYFSVLFYQIFSFYPLVPLTMRNLLVRCNWRFWKNTEQFILHFSTHFSNFHGLITDLTLVSTWDRRTSNTLGLFSRHALVCLCYPLLWPRVPRKWQWFFCRVGFPRTCT